MSEVLTLRSRGSSSGLVCRLSARDGWSRGCALHLCWFRTGTRSTLQTNRNNHVRSGSSPPPPPPPYASTLGGGGGTPIGYTGMCRSTGCFLPLWVWNRVYKSAFLHACLLKHAITNSKVNSVSHTGTGYLFSPFCLGQGSKIVSLEKGLVFTHGSGTTPSWNCGE